MENPNTGKIWLVTGAGTGLGKAVVEHALSRGDKVCATARKTSWPTLDVTSTAEISAAFATAVKAFGRIDVVYNNAGVAFFGETESDIEENSRRVFDVNFWGAVSVSKEAIRVFRDVNKPVGGHLLQASAIAGLQAVPVAPFYSASKSAFEAVSEALSKEVDPSWNIRINILVISSGFNTGVLDDMGSLLSPPAPPYASLPETSAVKAVRGFYTSGRKPDGDPGKFARCVFDIARDDKLETLRVPIGEKAIQTFTAKIEEHTAVLEKAKYIDNLKYTERDG